MNELRLVFVRTPKRFMVLEMVTWGFMFFLCIVLAKLSHNHGITFKASEMY